MAGSRIKSRGAKGTSRTRPRVEDTEEKAKAPAKDVISKVTGTSGILQGGQLEVTAQSAETVPVAQYANVILGPVGFRYVASGIDPSVFADVDWDNPKLTREQEAVFEAMKGVLRGGMAVVAEVINEDRALVEESVRRHNQKVKEEEAEKGKRR